MGRRFAWVWGLLLSSVLMLSSACFDDDFLAGFGEPIPLSEFEQSIVAAECIRESFCQVGQSGDAEHYEKCMAERALLPIRQRIRRLVVAAESGLLDYDGDAAWSCMFGLAVTCDDRADAFDKNPVCKLVFTGDVPQGGPCVLDEQCDGSCVRSDTADNVCAVGSCCAPPAAPAVLGESCADRPCFKEEYLNGLYCSDALVCEELKARGEPCTSNTACKINLWCPDGTCVDFTTLGVSCPCSSRWQRCNEQTNKCVASGVVGDSCVTSECAGHLYCTAETAVCTEQPKVGTPCGRTNTGPLVCAGAAYCDLDAAQPTCVSPLAIGQECDDDQKCESGHCDSGSRTCQDIATCFDDPPEPGLWLCPSDEQI